MAIIHPTSIVSPEAKLHPSVKVGPFCTIGPRVVIGEGTELISHVVIDGQTVIGAYNKLYPFVSIGLEPQDLKYVGEDSRVEIGDHNTFRECATIHRGTKGGTMVTKIGNNCLFMAYSHVAHDCIVGNHVIMANCAGLGGHVVVEDEAIFGGLSGIHQFCHVGRGAFLAGGAKVTQDVPPYCMVHGNRARLVGPNLEGLRRRRWSSEKITLFKEVFNFITFSPLPVSKRLAEARAKWPELDSDLSYFLEFIDNSKRGCCTHVSTGA